MECLELQVGFPEISLNSLFVLQTLKGHLTCLEVDLVLVIFTEVEDWADC